MIQTLGVIPSRYESVRFPGKPLVDIAGKKMIQRVYEQAKASGALDAIYVATDDQRIFSYCTNVNIPVIMTSDAHQSGTDRVAEVAMQFDARYVINIQGDEPLIPPHHITKLVEVLQSDNNDIATLITPCVDQEMLDRPDIVKLTKREDNRILYFSRSLIPYRRNTPDGMMWYRHLGVYAFKVDVLTRLTRLPLGLLERTEGLEQLRWLEAGYDIRAVEVPFSTPGVDSPEDLERLLAWMQQNDVTS